MKGVTVYFVEGSEIRRGIFKRGLIEYNLGDRIVLVERGRVLEYMYF